MGSLSEMVMRRYPEKREEFLALRDCQMAGWTVGAMAFVASGLGLFLASRTYARRVDQTAHMYVPLVTIVGASTTSAVTSWSVTKAEMAKLKARRQAEHQAALQAELHQEHGPAEANTAQSVAATDPARVLRL
jgi:hypothetical protein